MRMCCNVNGSRDPEYRPRYCCIS